MQTTGAWLDHACEIVNKRRRGAAPVLGAAVLGVVLLSPLAAVAQQQETPAESPVVDAHAGEQTPHADGGGPAAEDPHDAAAAHGAADDHGEAGAHGDDHGESIWSTLARVANFAILAGGLFYFLRGPIGSHLASRGAQIRGDLATAAAVRAEAEQRLVDIEQKLAALPAELEMVKQRGAEEVAAEEARIAQQAEIERERLVTQARREIAQQVRNARHALTTHAAALAIGAAESHLRSTLTAEDQLRLQQEFTSNLGGAQ